MAGSPYFNGTYFGPTFDAPSVLGGGGFLPQAGAAGCDNYFDPAYFDINYFCTGGAASDGGRHAVRLLQVPDEADELFALI